LCLCLCHAAPSTARDLETRDIVRSPAFSGLALGGDRAAPPVLRAPNMRLSNQSVARQDGSAGSQHAIIGSLPLVGPVAAEVGLFSVTGATVKEPEFKRTNPVADVQPRRSRVAAVGLRMRF
jgi:hypothetical protein